MRKISRMKSECEVILLLNSESYILLLFNCLVIYKVKSWWEDYLKYIRVNVFWSHWFGKREKKRKKRKNVKIETIEEHEGKKTILQKY
jgi:hypothetical protein